jgi:hypothetical protein
MENLLKIVLLILFIGTKTFAQSPPEKLTVANDPLRLAVGFFKTDITPDRSVDMFGYPFVMRPGNDGALDPLYVRATALRSEGKPAVIISFDLCVLPTEWALAFRQKVADTLKIGVERVLVSTTHTHAGPMYTAEYLKSIEDRAIETARKAAVMPCSCWARRQTSIPGYHPRILKMWSAWHVQPLRLSVFCSVE